MLIRSALAGFLIGETLVFSEIIGRRISSLLSNSVFLDAYLAAGLIAAIISLGYLQARGVFGWIKQLFTSGRIDIILIGGLGLLASLVGGGIGQAYYVKAVQQLTPWQWLLVVAMPLATFAILFIRSWLSVNHGANGVTRYFLSDAEVESSGEDLLGVRKQAEGFAERVLNEGSPDSLVFGIDAPWGIGKSSFVNFCMNYWRSKDTGRPVVFQFNPLRYESKTNLLEKFIDGLINALQEKAFIPELSPALSRYSRLIRTKEGVSFGGIKLDLFFLTHSVEDAYKELEDALARSEQKLIVIVDDLDRLPLTEIKDILFTIKVGFPLPNISYVLCYDTDNIALRKSEADDVREFLEKFVNVKIGLFIDPDALARYITTNLDRALKENPHIDPYTLAKIRETVVAAAEICNSSDFHYFQPYLGDVRKIKRLLNTIMLLEIHGTDFQNCDFSKHDLLYLLLLYINFPRIFRKIYNAETNGNWGIFSAVSYGDPGYPDDDATRQGSQTRPYKNSTYYTDYAEKLSDEQRFLLDKLFHMPPPPERPYVRDLDDTNKKVQTSSACFNGTRGTPHNLQRYLQLIVRQSKPIKREQQQFYLNKVIELGKGAPFDEIFRDEEFATMNGEGSRARFWRVLINTRENLARSAGPDAIRYFLNHFPHFSLIILDGTELVGFRDDAAYLLAKLLDEFGWSTSGPSRVANTPENIAEIAEWIFGDGRHEGEGVIQKLSSPDRGPLGIYDLMIFRLMCSADRHGDIFNLTRAIAFHGDPNAPTSGNTREIARAEMRELSQAAFQIFSEQYILPGKNIFSEIDAVTLEALTGDYYEYARQQAQAKASTEAQLNAATSSLKSLMKSFIIYQLGNKRIESGVGCGLYDIEGNADNAGIAAAVNAYLFCHCFNPERDETNCFHFLNYAIINYGSRFSFELDPGYVFVPSIEELTKVLDRDLLTRYWDKNQAEIRTAALKALDTEVRTTNFTISYRDALPGLFQALDALLTEPVAQSEIQPTGALRVPERIQEQPGD